MFCSPDELPEGCSTNRLKDDGILDCLRHFKEAGYHIFLCTRDKQFACRSQVPNLASCLSFASSNQSLNLLIIAANHLLLEHCIAAIAEAYVSQVRLSYGHRAEQDAMGVLTALSAVGFQTRHRQGCLACRLKE